MLIPEAHFDMVRCGIAIYGLWPSAETQNEFLKIRNPKSEIRNKSKIINSNFLKPVLSFKTKIVQIKEVKVGDKIGYGCTFEVKKPMTIAVIPVGYFEGMDRGLSNPNTCIHLRGVCKGEVLVCGKRCPIVGRICMNMSVINITQIRNTKSEIRNSEVVIIGKQASRQARGAYAEITADEIAKKIGTINYEIVTRIPEYIKRVYK
ncbi:hypothetical protein A3F08_01845 [Candidatus Berkelbacteria bacterium RIFCSPHIGHO2_12_FULL_36_9]|uniref:Alanine racemase C-terminal domain-containing protein n=1 Tax=Candidatus Berkelbacteria bacterium RIFCSPHIGHO2_12_FULL_36_9 TaxID=1797469 RepID=A0A1F5EEF9_9BACT|nr:MAG: hypothetical protein A3F08_01845 [Candidatus Berkelbacteria bacterium RIFCSPHIGHO2_12_FULL_36_9]